MNKTKMVVAGALLAITALAVAPGTAHAVQPYFKVAGGDIVAGASFSTDNTPCTGAGLAPHINEAGILGWNTKATLYAGAGTEYAARARGYIQEFSTRQVTPGSTTQLSFANVNTAGSVNPAAGLFGGMFGDAPCIDYWGAKPALASLQPIADGALPTTTGDYSRISGDLTIDGSNIPDGAHITVYVDGDVSITGDILYANTNNWADRKSIPSLRLIVKGTIFIGKDVQRLDGLYVAVPDATEWGNVNKFDDPLDGTITSCSTGFASYNPSKYLTEKIEATCGKPLTVNGSLAAHQIWLLRSTGTLGSTPAEIINFQPEMWMSATPPSSTNLDTDYQSIIGLPPQL